MQIVSNGDNLYEMSNPFSGKNIINMSSAELAKRVVKVTDSSIFILVMISNKQEHLFYFYITKTRLFKYTENFSSKKLKFSVKKNSDIFHISAQNTDCGYSLEPPWRGSSNEYQQSMFLSNNKKNNVYPCKSQFYYIKVGFKGVKII